MKLQEKILYCRKKAGLSQEALAEQTGVSRQAVSKWETGEALPEIGKLVLLAKVFGVTTDWLLSEDEEEPEQEERLKEEQKKQENRLYVAVENAANMESTNWVESIPGVIGKLIKRYGWLAGVYIAVVGAGFMMMGILARVLVRQMVSGTPFRQTVMEQIMGNDFYGPEYMFESGFQGSFNVGNITSPFFTMATALIVFGVIVMVAGIVIAVILKKKSKE